MSSAAPLWFSVEDGLTRSILLVSKRANGEGCPADSNVALASPKPPRRWQAHAQVPSNPPPPVAQHGAQVGPIWACPYHAAAQAAAQDSPPRQETIRGHITPSGHNCGIPWAATTLQGMGSGPCRARSTLRPRRYRPGGLSVVLLRSFPGRLRKAIASQVEPSKNSASWECG